MLLIRAQKFYQTVKAFLQYSNWWLQKLIPAKTFLRFLKTSDSQIHKSSKFKDHCNVVHNDWSGQVKIEDSFLHSKFKILNLKQSQDIALIYGSALPLSFAPLNMGQTIFFVLVLVLQYLKLFSHIENY